MPQLIQVSPGRFRYARPGESLFTLTDVTVRPRVRHLIYHIYPLRGETWRWNVQQLLRRIDLFNGKRIIAIVTDDKTESADVVAETFNPDWQDDDNGFEFIVLPNDPKMREMVTFEKCLERLADHGADDVVFSAHAKGVTHANNDAVRQWTTTLYETCLDYWPVVATQLENHPCTGTVKKVGRGFTGNDHSDSQWHYSGSFFWARCTDVFSRDWRDVLDQRWFGSETAISKWFSADEAGFLLACAPVADMHLYTLSTLLDKISPVLAEFRRVHANRQTKTLRVELGGGAIPRAGFVNVDQCESADVRLDLSRDPLPFGDDSVDEVYSSHCLEHVSPYRPLLHEIVRVCKVGAFVVIRVPSWLSSMAMCQGHAHTISENQVRHWTKDFISDWWGGCSKRLSLNHTSYSRGESFNEWRTIFPQITEEQVMRLCPGACHDITYTLQVVPNS